MLTTVVQATSTDTQPLPSCLSHGCDHCLPPGLALAASILDRSNTSGYQGRDKVDSCHAVGSERQALQRRQARCSGWNVTFLPCI